jgi:hypothetical protein
VRSVPRYKVGNQFGKRDVFMHVATPDDAFLRRSLDLSGTVRLDRRRFAFYHYRWAVREIADYATRIFFGDNAPAEDGHARTELQPYLPVPHREIEAAVDAAEAAVRRVSGLTL